MLFCVEQDAILGSNDWEIGLHALNKNNEQVELIDIVENIENIEGYKFYNIFTRHYRYLANGILCGHSQATLYKEFLKVDNKKYRPKNQKYLNHLRRKYLEQQMRDHYMIPFGVDKEIYTVYNSYDFWVEEEKKKQNYLNETDYQVIKFKTDVSSLSIEEYTNLETKREKARERIRQSRRQLAERDERVNKIFTNYLDTISDVKGVW